MKNNIYLRFKTDAKTKSDLMIYANELGLTSTALVNMVVKQALRDHRLVLSVDLEPTPYLENIMREAEADYKADRNITHTKGPKEALAHLDSLM